MWNTVRPRLRAASELLIAMGGKRYLSGFIDPDGRLNPGFVKFEPPPQ